MTTHRREELRPALRDLPGQVAVHGPGGREEDALVQALLGGAPERRPALQQRAWHLGMAQAGSHVQPCSLHGSRIAYERRNELSSQCELSHASAELQGAAETPSDCV